MQSAHNPGEPLSSLTLEDFASISCICALSKAAVVCSSRKRSITSAKLLSRSMIESFWSTGVGPVSGFSIRLFNSSISFFLAISSSVTLSNSAHRDSNFLILTFCFLAYSRSCSLVSSLINSIYQCNTIKKTIYGLVIQLRATELYL